ncbi:MAG TPA: DinB family protein [Candidatus Limnocylindrales bacterium]|nr:DinB family protein [Candidatus Limnocylindrales bacterium]
MGELEPAAPDLVAVWLRIEPGQSVRARREIRRRAREESVERTLAQLEATAEALIALVEGLPEAAFSEPGGEEEWNVAEAIGHVAIARSGLVVAAGLAASGRWPADAPTVVPGVPGPSGAARAELVLKLAQSQRIIARMATSIVGHETDPCPLHHPLVGRLRCGEWLFFAGIHDLMHIEQLESIAERLGEAGESASIRQAGSRRRPGAHLAR